MIPFFLGDLVAKQNSHKGMMTQIYKSYSFS